jgi:hypothetical protein
MLTPFSERWPIIAAMRTRFTSPRRRLPPLRSTVAKVTALASVGFVVLWIALAAQMAAGSDPALGPKARAARSDRSVRQVRQAPSEEITPQASARTPAGTTTEPAAPSTPAPVVTSVS